MDRFEITLASICISIFLFFMLIISVADNTSKIEEINRLKKQIEEQSILIDKLNEVDGNE